MPKRAAKLQGDPIQWNDRTLEPWTVERRNSWMAEYPKTRNAFVYETKVSQNRIVMKYENNSESITWNTYERLFQKSKYITELAT